MSTKMKTRGSTSRKEWTPENVSDDSARLSAMNRLKQYVEQVKDLEKVNKELRHQIQEKQSKGVAENGGVESDSFRKEIDHLKEENKKLKLRLIEQKKEFKEVFEKAKSSFKKQGAAFGAISAREAKVQCSEEIAYLKDKMQALKDECKRAKSDVKQAVLEKKEILKEMAKNNAAARKDHNVVDRGLLQKENETLKVQVKEMQRKLKEFELAEEDNIYLRAENERLEASLVSMANAAKAIRAQGETEETSSNDHRVRELEAEVEELGDELERATETIEALQKEGSEKQAKIENLQREAKNFQKTLVEVGEKKQRLEQDAQILRRERNALEDKVRQLKRLSSSPRREKQSSSSSSNDDEVLAALQQQLETVQRNHALLEDRYNGVLKEKDRLEAHIRDLEQRVDRQRLRHQEEMRQMDGDIGTSKQAAALVEQVEKLQQEVQMYRDLASSQEHQFSLLYIQEINTVADYLVVENRTNLDVSLAGWYLKSQLTDASYEFPEDLMIPAKGKVKVWWGLKNESYKARPVRGNLFWEESERYNIFKSKDDVAVLEDPEGYEMSRINVVIGKCRVRAGPQYTSPAPERKRPRASFGGFMFNT